MDEHEYSPVLSSPLKRRISRVVAIDDILQNVELDSNASKPQKDNNTVYIEPRTMFKALSKPESNWISAFLKQRRDDRITWNSKLHHAKNQFSKKSMYEQAEELMDIAADDFAECINKLSDDDKHKINGKMVKALFSIEIESDISRALNVKMLPMPVVSQEIAQLQNCPELIIEKNISKLMRKNEKARAIAPKYHAFGRSLSPTSQYRKHCEFAKPAPFQFPEEIRSGENLFQGIDRLRSTKALIKHLEDNNQTKPQYLQEMSSSNKQTNYLTTEHVPLFSIYQ